MKIKLFLMCDITAKTAKRFLYCDRNEVEDIKLASSRNNLII